MAERGRVLIFVVTVTVLGLTVWSTASSSFLTATRVFRDVGVIALDENGAVHAWLRTRNRVATISGNQEVHDRFVLITQSATAMALAHQHPIVVGSDRNTLKVYDSHGAFVRDVRVPAVSSIAALSTGTLVIASPTVSGRLHIVNILGARLRSFGDMRGLHVDAAQNQYLNRGLVAVGKDDEIYFVFNGAARPVIEKWAVDGTYLGAFEISGEAVRRIAGLAQEALDRWTSESCPGGITTVTALAADRGTGHIFAAMDAETGVPNVYEYDRNGNKIAEYVLKRDDTQLLHVDALAAGAGFLYAQVADSVYEFKVASPSAARFRFNGLVTRLRKTGAILFNAASQDVAAQTLCPAANDMPGCSVNCPTGGTADCKATLYAAKASSHIVIGYSCTAGGTQCSGSITVCNPDNGQQSTISTTRQCPKDQDSDGWDEFQDCNDNNSSINPGAAPWCIESSCGMHDDNCNGSNDCVDCGFTPIVVDVRGDGFRLTDLASGVWFDMSGDGVKERTSWTSSEGDDAWLVLDRNGNGTIDDTRELFGNVTPQPTSHQPNGFIALAVLDAADNGGNDDGVVSVEDRMFGSLRLWHDSNQNGASEPSELVLLIESGIVSLSTDYREIGRKDRFGNLFRYTAPVERQFGTTGPSAYDVILIH